MKAKKNEYVLGIDLGGTKIYAAVVDKKGRIISSARKKTKPEKGFKNTVNRIAKCATKAVKDAEIEMNDIQAVGVGSPGPLDLKEGKIIETPNMDWKDAPLKQDLSNLLERPVSIDNDGNVGVLGELAYGAGQGVKHLIGLFIGTGIGGGIIIDGKLLHGYNENAAELGHLILDPYGPKCGCGNNGCLEAFAGRLAIEREIKIAQLHGKETTIFDDLKPNERLRSKRLAKAYKKNDPAAVEAIEKSAMYVGYGVASLLNALNPQMVVLGGGVVEAIGEPYIKIVKKYAEDHVFAIAKRNVRIVKAKLKDDSAVLGAARLAWDSLQHS
jgi:glucokinase